MNIIPVSCYIVFVLSTLFAGWAFYKASRRSTAVIIMMAAWLLLQSAISLTGFYTDTSSMPPRFPLLVLPAIICIILLFATAKGRIFIDGLDTRWLTLVHIVRIPVEIGLLILSVEKLVPQLMTFEGRNFDILAGLSSIFIYYFSFVKKIVSKKILLLWNFISLGLLLNIVINAVLSVPTPFQQFAFDRPNVALLYFPVTMLPCLIVPIVLLSHLAAIRQLTRSNKASKLVIIT